MLILREPQQLPLGRSRQHPSQQAPRLSIEQVLPRPTVTQHVEDRLAIL
jgi:hypothetical protein